MKCEGLHGKKLNKRCGRDTDAGFTLVELLIAVVILAIIVIPLLRMFITSSRINVRSRQVLRATTVAQDIMEGLKAYSLDEVRTQFSPPEGVDPDTVEFYYPSDGFFIINSSMIQGGVREITELGPDTSGEQIYYFGIENVKMQGSEYDALIKLDASTYGSKSKEAIDNTGADGTGALHDNEFNGTFYADIGSVSETAAADESLKAADSSYHEDKNLEKDVLKDIKRQVEDDVPTDDLPDDWDEDEKFVNYIKIQKRTIHVLFKDAGTMDAEGNPECSATINITYECRYEYNGTTRSYGSKGYAGSAGGEVDNIRRIFSSGNFYLFYYPVYAIGSTVDHIEFEFEGADRDKLFGGEHPLLKSITLAKQIRSEIRAGVGAAGDVLAPELSDSDLYSNEGDYQANVSFTGFADFEGENDLIFRTNIDTNMAERAKRTDSVTGKVTRDPVNGVVFSPTIGTYNHLRKVDLTGENVSNKITNVIYDVEITVYQTGAAEHFEHALETDFEEDYGVHRLAFISSLN